MPANKGMSPTTMKNNSEVCAMVGSALESHQRLPINVGSLVSPEMVQIANNGSNTSSDLHTLTSGDLRCFKSGDDRTSENEEFGY